MEKRIFIAVLISIALLFGWAAIAPKLFPELMKKPQPAASKSVAEKTATPAASSTTTTSAAPLAPAAPVAASGSEVAPATPTQVDRVQLSVIDTPQYTATLSNRGAQLVSFRLKKYTQKHSTDKVEIVKARDASRTDYPFAIVPGDAALRRLNSVLYDVTDRQEGANRIIEYRYSDGRVAVTKTFRFTPQPFLFDFSVSMNPPAPYRVAVGPGIRTLGAEEQDSRVVMTGNGVVQRDGKFRVINREKGESVHVYDAITYIGIEDNYFLTVLRPSKSSGTGVLQRVLFHDAKTKKSRPDLYAAVNANSQGLVAGDAFFGPKETKLLDQYNMGEALQFGWFGLIARFFLRALVWLNQFTKNYGFAIIVLTILIKIVLYPLQHKSIVSMKKMQKVQPKVEAIKAKYKKSRTDAEQRQKMNVEMMQLYQKEGINPMAGCLPLVLQLPILWGFYNLLSRAIELRGADFILWIRDLSDKDPTYVLPILMTVTMFIQTYITPATGDPAQRKMFLMMPLVMGFLFKDFPSGLVLYWLVQNILTIVQQSIMNKWWKDHPGDIQNA